MTHPTATNAVLIQAGHPVARCRTAARGGTVLSFGFDTSGGLLVEAGRGRVSRARKYDELDALPSAMVNAGGGKIEHPYVRRVKCSDGESVFDAVVAQEPTMSVDERIVYDVISDYVEPRGPDHPDYGPGFFGSIETAHDECGDLVGENVVEAINARLPTGWTAEWTGSGTGDSEDFTVVTCVVQS